MEFLFDKIKHRHCVNACAYYMCAWRKMEQGLDWRRQAMLLTDQAERSGKEVYRFFVPSEQIREDKAEITGDDVNHIRNVLRMVPGEKVVISGGQGMDYYCIIRDVQSECILLEIERQEAVRTELPVEIVLFQALPKADKIDRKSVV